MPTYTKKAAAAAVTATKGFVIRRVGGMASAMLEAAPANPATACAVGRISQVAG
jgi:hypothetical protein